jgi:hypothetical protein
MRPVYAECEVKRGVLMPIEPLAVRGGAISDHATS